MTIEEAIKLVAEHIEEGHYFEDQREMLVALLKEARMMQIVRELIEECDSEEIYRIGSAYFAAHWEGHSLDEALTKWKERSK